jgi:sterol desaturase/sphingolipid hydroxylase (fatty acid hydroxylase superfamily)
VNQIEPLVPFLILGFFAVGLVLERLLAARPLPVIRRWSLRGGIVFFVTLAVNGLVPALLADAVGARAPLHLSSLGLLGGAAVAFLASDLFGYWLHRLQHRVPRLWRWTHQMHHAAERVDVLGAAFFHPFDIALQAAVTTVVVGLLGVSADAAALAGVTGVFLAVFQHLNVRTPRWLGYLVQRPEQHSVHHERGVHAYNYGNLSLWDLAFGTFRNPAEFSATAGFWDGASARIGAMLLGRDVERRPG